MVYFVELVASPRLNFLHRGTCGTVMLDYSGSKIQNTRGMDADRLVAASLVESVWLDRRKYEESETRFQEIIAQQHSKLEVVVELRSWRALTDVMLGLLV